MWTIFGNEIKSFFNSVTGYLVISIFLFITGLFVWIFPTYNVLDGGFATLDGFFDFAPLIFLFLIPAITMRSIAEEKSNGTLEFLTTKPLSDFSLLTGKYLAAFALFIFSLLPTLIYVWTISRLANPAGDIDTGAIVGSYIGLIFIGAAYTAIGLFASSISNKQVVAFLIGLFICFIAFYAFDFLSNISAFNGSLDYTIKNIGLQAHYASISRGVLDTRDVIYFLTFVALFITASKTALESRKW